jgi:hypothetical protein
LTDGYVELLVKWAPKAKADAARQWLEKRGLTVTPAPAIPGAIVLGTNKQIEAALSVSLADAKPPTNLSIPEEMRDHIESITILKPPSYHL